MPGWEIVTPAQMGIVCFRHQASDDAGHLELVQKILRDGFALVTSTILRGRTVLRMCPINPRSTEADVEETLKRLDRFAREG
jgi:glutamate/tyrosine decarboxylase-like PLP-dependent enzyme